MLFEPGKKLVIVNHLSERVAEALRAHPSAPEVETLKNPAEPWVTRADADVIVTRLLPGWRNAPAVAPPEFSRIKWFQTRSAGLDTFPKWIFDHSVVASGRGLAAPYIAEYAMTAILRQVKPMEDVTVKEGKWVPKFLGSLIGAKIGVIGYGAIAQEFIARALPFGPAIRVYRRSGAPSGDPRIEVRSDLNDLLTWADHLLVAAPLTPDTKGLLSDAALQNARPGLHLINVARGELVDQEALIRALDAGQLGHATLDVTTPEPLPEDHPLLWHSKVTVTPHISWSGGDLDELFIERMLRSLTSVAEGGLPNTIVDPKLGY